MNGNVVSVAGFTDPKGEWYESGMESVSPCRILFAPQAGYAFCCLVALQYYGYTSGMKTAVSIPDELFEQAERLPASPEISK